MSIIKTTQALILGLLMTGAHESIAQGWPTSPAQRAQVFAVCAGRLSALADHQRYLDANAADRAETQRLAFDALLQAVMPDALDYGMPGAQALNWRMHAKLAQSSLLMRADFNSDDQVKARARAAAEAFLNECDGFVLS